jgi:hypothetical protein
VLRGQFSPGERGVQWCERHLLARIHRYTVKRLRREIEPVSLQDFMRFLFDWQHLAGDERLRGPQAVGEVLGQLQASRPPPAPGRRNCCRRGSRTTVRTGWTTPAAAASGPGAGWRPRPRPAP